MHSSISCEREEKTDRRRRRRRSVNGSSKCCEETRPSVDTVSAQINLWTLLKNRASSAVVLNHMKEHNIPMEYASLFNQIQNMPQPMYMSNPVILFDGFSQQPFAFSLDTIDSLSVRPLTVASFPFAYP
jgi:hypothetical protein